MVTAYSATFRPVVVLLIVLFLTTPVVVVEARTLRYMGTGGGTQPLVQQSWTEKTGHNISQFFTNPIDMYGHVEQDITLDTPLFDIYQYSHLPVDYAAKGLILDISKHITEERFHWNEIVLAAREWLTQFDGKIWTVPIDTNTYAMYYRRDLIGSAPNTWEEYIEVIKRFHGKDLNGDGVPDFGMCTNSDGQFFNLAFTVAVTVMKYKKGARQGYLYDVNDDDTLPMKSLMKTKGWEYVMNITKELSKYAEGVPIPLSTSFPAFSSGRCATYLSFPSAGTLTVTPGSFMHGKLGAARAPGSKLVYDRELDELVPCTIEKCPFMESGGVNRRAYTAGGLFLMINAKSPNVDLALDYAAHATMNLDVRIPGFINVFRQRHFNATYFENAPMPWERIDAEQYLAANREALDSSASSTSPRTPNAVIIQSNVERAMKLMLGFYPFNETTPPPVGEILADMDKRIGEESLAAGHTPRFVEDLYRRGLSLPPLSDPISNLTTTIVKTDDDQKLLLGILIAVVLMVLLLLLVAFVHSVLQRPTGIDNAPLDESLPFVVIHVSTHPKATRYFADCATEAGAFLLQSDVHARKTEGNGTFVCQELPQVFVLLEMLQKIVSPFLKQETEKNEEAGRTDEQQQRQNKFVVAFTHGHGTIVPPLKRSEEPRYGGRVVDTAEELFAIACNVPPPQSSPPSPPPGNVGGVILTIGEVAASVKEMQAELKPSMGGSTSVDCGTNPLDVLNDLELSQQQEAAETASQKSCTSSTATQSGRRRADQRAAKAMQKIGTLKDALDRKFKGGMIRRIVSVRFENISQQHADSEDVKSACLAYLDDQMLEQHSNNNGGGQQSPELGVANNLNDEDEFTIDTAALNLPVKTVQRRGSVVHIDCTRSQTAAELFQMHEVFKAVAHHFGGEVEYTHTLGAVATFGVHRANTLHEQNACRCALQLQSHLQTTICVTSGPMSSSSPIQQPKTANNATSSSSGGAIATGIPMSTAVLMSNHFATSHGVGRIFAQQDVMFAAPTMLTLPHDVLSFHTTKGELQSTMIVHELFSSESYPFAAHPPSDAKLFKSCFEKMRKGSYLIAAEKLRVIDACNPQVVRLSKMIQYLLETEGDSGEGYTKRLVGTVSPAFSKDAATDKVEVRSAQVSGSTFVGGGGNTVAGSSTSSVFVGGNASTSSSNAAALSRTDSDVSILDARESTTEKQRRTRVEVSQALKSRVHTALVDDGLISMFVDDSGILEDDASGALLELPTTLVDVSGVSWTRSERSLSAGSFATVYRAISEVGRNVTVKCFDMESGKVQITPEDIANEVSTLSSFMHENIIGYVTYGFMGRYCFIVMEHASGGSLYSVVRDFGALGEAAAKTYIRDSLRGLEYLHKNNVVHCDIKPHNILIGSDGICKIADFGSTIDMGFAGENSEEKRVIARGTAAYMAPEACRGTEGPAGDIWSMGITIIELLTGQLPWGKLGNLNHFIVTLGSNEKMVPHIPEQLGAEVQELLHACLQRDVGKRPTAAEALAFPFFL